jgi:hypothetical protein
VIVVAGDMPLADKRNLGAAKGKNKIILFIDDDNELSPNALDNAILNFTDGMVAVVGLIATYDDDRKKICDGGAFRNFTTGLTTDHFVNKNLIACRDPYEVDEVANAFMIRRSVFNFMKGFDAESFPIDLDEADLCARIKAIGLKISSFKSALPVAKPYAPNPANPTIDALSTTPPKLNEPNGFPPNFAILKRVFHPLLTSCVADIFSVPKAFFAFITSLDIFSLATCTLSGIVNGTLNLITFPISSANFKP